MTAAIRKDLPQALAVKHLPAKGQPLPGLGETRQVNAHEKKRKCLGNRMVVVGGILGGIAIEVPAVQPGETMQCRHFFL